VMERSSYDNVKQPPGTHVGQLDIETVVRASQALSSEIVLPTLIEKLLRLAVEHAGAERSLLILLNGEQPYVEAEATAAQGQPEVTVRRTAITPSDLPPSALHHVIRTRERVVLDDASVRGPYSDDEYVGRRRPRSVLCLPMVKHTKLVGALYLENTLTPSAFTSDRVAVLELLASQAAISLENATLYSDLQRSEAASRESEQGLRQIIDTIPGFVCTLNAAGGVELFNRQVLDYFGKTVEELKNWAASDAVHPDDLPRVIDAWRRAVETGKPYENEHRERRADGVYRWFQSRALPARDAEGRITGWYMLLTDIDDRKKAEQELRSSKAYLTEAQGLSLTGSFGCNVSTGEMFWSEETFRIFGYDRATTPSVEAILDRVHPEDKGRVQEQIQSATSEGRDCDLEYRLSLPGDSVRHVHVVAKASKEPGGFEFLGAIMDVTAAKEAAERIRQDERELRITIETIPAIVSSTLADGTVEFVSRRWLDYVGLSREEILGGAWKSTIHPDDLGQVLTNWQAALATGEPLEMETRYRRADGQYRWFLVRAVPLRDEMGSIVKWYATVFDIEERKRNETLLAGQKRVLEMVAKGDALPRILDALCRVVEEHSSDVLSSFLLLDAKGTHLRHSAGPRLPQSYIDAIDGVAIGPTGGSCITAAHRAAPVIVSDIATDPLWATYRHLPLAHGLRACWSTPIISSEGKVLGTFAMYYRRPRSPSAQDLHVLEQVASLAAVSIKHKQAEESLLRSEAYLAEAQRLSHTGSWAHDVATGERTHSSEEFRRLYAFDPEAEAPPREEFRKRIHPDDLDRIVSIYERAVSDRTDFEADYRVVHPDGTIKYVHVIGHPVFNAAGDLVEYIGSSLDVTERKRAEHALEDLAGRLIHAQEEERSRIGRELHDHISQTLGVLTIKIDQLRAQEEITAGIGGALDELRRATTEITDDVHRLSHRLHSSTLDYLGLIPALQKLAAEFSERHGILVAFAHESLPASLPSEVALCLFRVAEESLANIAKHSQAHSATLEVRGGSDGIHLRVEDAGAGFDMTASESKAGLGFVSMQERLRALHGTLHVDSIPRKGTRIEAWVPTIALTKPDHEARATAP